MRLIYLFTYVFYFGLQPIIYSQDHELERQQGYELSTDCGNSIKYLNLIPITFDFSLQSSTTFEYPEIEDVLKGVAKVNEHLNEHDIYIHVPEIYEQISKTTFGELSTLFFIIDSLGIEDAVVGFFRSKGDLDGQGYSIPNYFFRVRGFDNSVSEDELGIVAHELGHNLGLFHTFYQPGVGSDTMELADGSNCAFAGDYICDTPADHKSLEDSVSSGTCILTPPSIWDPDIIDPPLNPDITNLMSYYPFDCRNNFTSDQGLAMHCVLANSATYMDGQIITSK